MVFAMEFPVYLDLGPLRIHPHLLFEALAYAIGFRWFLIERRVYGDPLPGGQRLSVAAAAVLGAAAGSKVLVWLVDPAATWAGRGDAVSWLEGKTIVGALIGGVLAVEWTKRRMGVVARTGDAFAVPVAVGILIGRIGCFLTGLTDRTFGIATGLPWGVDFGDGIARHPTQIYEQIFLVAVIAWLLWRRRSTVTPGSQWHAMLVAYMGWRLAVGFIQPGWRFAGLTTLQWAAAAMLTYLANAAPSPAAPAVQARAAAPQRRPTDA